MKYKKNKNNKIGYYTMKYISTKNNNFPPYWWYKDFNVGKTSNNKIIKSTSLFGHILKIGDYSIDYDQTRDMFKDIYTDNQKLYSFTNISYNANTIMFLKESNTALKYYHDMKEIYDNTVLLDPLDENNNRYVNIFSLPLWCQEELFKNLYIFYINENGRDSLISPYFSIILEQLNRAILISLNEMYGSNASIDLFVELLNKLLNDKAYYNNFKKSSNYKTDNINLINSIDFFEEYWSNHINSSDSRETIKKYVDLINFLKDNKEFNNIFSNSSENTKELLDIQQLFNQENKFNLIVSTNQKELKFIGDIIGKTMYSLIEFYIKNCPLNISTILILDNWKYMKSFEDFSLDIKLRFYSSLFSPVLRKRVAIYLNIENLDEFSNANLMDSSLLDIILNSTHTKLVSKSNYQLLQNIMSKEQIEKDDIFILE